MIRMIAMGLWVCLVALGALVFSLRVNAVDPNTSEKSAPVAVEIGSNNTEVMSVPILVDGDVQGYIIAQFAYVVDKTAEKEISIPVGVLINDTIFQYFWGSYSDVRAIEKVKFEMIKERIIDDVNKRFSKAVLKDLLVKQFNYLSVDQIRGMKNKR
ncbi:MULTISPECIES: hypothetical protein [unclassified Bartonella]|uniref:hypothetical protein n=1 Tax=unclassified Bartonella TaxID=2645622 RepID=UPI00099A4500|nr:MULTISPECIES: hypothetical protein [unclassified Bartonella]AQX18631.1 hypothetical protein BA1379B_008070 [Bartonella sp. A1379B]AQX23145.1 hypothetical protein Bho11B_011460 [Bartonella sp. 11B]AQX23556.1 hypothetical protein Bho114_002140 [Bartonella sp. 114]AQX25600.1 hypothetical protein Bco22_009260 [Bartonella sp. Coyote22sub2]